MKIKTLTKNYTKLITACVFFAVLICLYFFIDPSKSHFFLKCPLKSLTGYECAGCGVQRAFHELLHFRFLEAFRLNPLFVMAVPFFLIFVIAHFSDEGKLKSTVRRATGSKIFVIVLILIVFVFSLLKNTEFYKDFILNL